MNAIKSLFFILKKTVIRLFAEDYAFRASALAYTTLLSLVPLLSVLVYLLTFSPPLFTRIINLTRDYLVENFIPSANITIEGYLQNFIDQAARLPALGFIFLVVAAVLLIITVDGVLNEIWQQDKRKKRIMGFVWRWLVLLVTPLIIGISLFISSYVLNIPWILELINRLGVQKSLLTLSSLVLNTLIFTIVNMVVPRCKVKWRAGLLGGLMTALLFEAAKSLFAFVMKHSTYQAIYGTLAIIPVFLFWLYVYWLIVLFGALLAHSQQQLKLATPTSPPP